MVEQPSSAPLLQQLDDSAFQRVLVVVAHPDDAEYGTSAAVASWTQRGIEVGYLLATAGEAGMQRPPTQARTIRLAEQREACQIVGVDHLTVLDFPDGLVEYGIALRSAIAHEIRKFQPDAVITGAGELKVGWGLDHADHRAVGLATIDAIRDAGNQWLFTDQLVDAVTPWEVSRVLLTGTQPTHFVEVADSEIQRAVASLTAHRQYLADIPDHPVPAEFIPEILRATGASAGVDAAMAFALA